MKNQGSREGIWEQVSWKVAESATDFHLLHTEVRRKKTEVDLNHPKRISSSVKPRERPNHPRPPLTGIQTATIKKQPKIKIRFEKGGISSNHSD